MVRAGTVRQAPPMLRRRTETCRQGVDSGGGSVQSGTTPDGTGTEDDMSYSNMVIREAEAREDDARDYSDAMDALGAAVAACDGSAYALSELLANVIGKKAAAQVLTEYLTGDADVLCDAVVGWHKGRQA
jgi:hypothetical protein